MENKENKQEYYAIIIADAITAGNVDLFTDEIARISIKISKLLIEELNNYDTTRIC